MEPGADRINEAMEPKETAAVRRLVEPAIRRMGLELVLVELRRENGRLVLRLYVGLPEHIEPIPRVAVPAELESILLPDSSSSPDPLAARGTSDEQPVAFTGSPPDDDPVLVRQGGVTLDDCAEVSREVSALLDVEDPISQSYVLEVSSPGIERPLVRLSDFAKHTGQPIRLRTTQQLGGRQNFRGILQGLVSEQVVVAEPDGDKTIPYDLIKRANLVVELESAPRPSRRGKE